MFNQSTITIQNNPNLKEVHLKNIYESTFQVTSNPNLINLSAENVDQSKVTQSNLRIPEADKGEFVLHIMLESDKDIETMMAFMENTDNAELFNHIEVVRFKEVDQHNQENVQELLNLMAYKCPNLRSLSFENLVSCDLHLSAGFPNLHSCFCKMDKSSLAISSLENLNEFSCTQIHGDTDNGDQRSRLTLSKLPNLSKVSIGNMDKSIVNVLDDQNLNDVTFKNIDQSRVNVLKNEVLRDLSIATIDHSTVNVLKSENLSKVSVEAIRNSSLTIPEAQKDASISLRNTDDKSKITLPEND